LVTEVAGIRALPAVGEVQPVLRFGGRLGTATQASIDVFVDVIDLAGNVWKPTLGGSTRHSSPSVCPSGVSCAWTSSKGYSSGCSAPRWGS
jgi:hypothetical protein